MVDGDVRLRRARAEDAPLLLAWRNDPATRAASLSQHEISPDEHRRWLHRKLDDPECFLSIVEESTKPIGQVRVDRLSPALAELSIALAPEARGRGLGRRAIELGTTQAREVLGVHTVKACVRADNESSLRAFRATGYEDVGLARGIIELRRRA